MINSSGVLIIEDSTSLSLTYQAYLKDLNEPIFAAADGKEAFQKLDKHRPAVILLDLHLPDMHGLDILDHLKEIKHPASIIVITAHGSVQVAVEAMQRGAIDFLLKPFAADRLRTTVKNALSITRLHQRVAALKGRRDKAAVGSFIGESAPMQAVYDMINDAAPSRASVFIIGESGTGKELCANAIHDLSPRQKKPLVALNCAAIPANLMESEIFGHIKGAFTGATEDREGAAERAHGGTLFLDEICEMPLDLQAKLLRFIQTGQVAPVGSSKVKKVDVRFVCATNRHPFEAVQAGDFREDLYYRLHVIPIIMPPLRDRESDVIVLANTLLKKFSEEENRDFESLDDAAIARLKAHTWPGNVRELGNVIQSAAVLHNGPVMTGQMIERILGSITQPLQPVKARPLKTPIYAEALPTPANQTDAQGESDVVLKTAPKGEAGLTKQAGTGPEFGPKSGPESGPESRSESRSEFGAEIGPDYGAEIGANAQPGAPERPRNIDNLTALPSRSEIRPLHEIERDAIEAALKACNGRVREAAKHLAVNPSTLYRKIQSWETGSEKTAL